MNLRPTQASIFNLVRSGILSSTGKLVTAQEQLASGKRINRLSDDGLASSLALAFRRQLASQERHTDSARSARDSVDASASALEGVSGLLTQARAVVLQGLNGTTSPEDRRVLASEIEGIRDQVMDLANERFGDRYLFGGTETTRKPFETVAIGGQQRAVYRGNDDQQELEVGVGSTVGTGLPGSRVFARRGPGQTIYAGLTGAAPGLTVDQGVGTVTLDVRHDATSGALGSGLALVGGGASDTILGDHVMVVDATAGTVQLDAGPALTIPAPGDPSLSDFVVRDENGAELHLDFSAYSGASSTSNVRGDGSVSIDGASYTTLDFLDNDLELIEVQTGAVLHLDTVGIRRAGAELVTFGGTVSAIDLLQGIADDLNDIDGLGASGVIQRLQTRLGELDRNHQNVLEAVGVLGARSANLSAAETRLEAAGVRIQDLLSRQEDADVSEVVLDLTSAQQTLQLSEAAGVRLLQTSLLDFLR